MRVRFSAAQRIDLQGQPIQLYAETVPPDITYYPPMQLTAMLNPITEIDDIERAFKAFIEGCRREEARRA